MSTSRPEPSHASSLRTQSLPDRSAYGCALLARSGRIVSVTRSFAQLLGSPARLLFGRSIFEFLVPAQRWKNYKSLSDGGNGVVLCRGRRINLTMHKIAQGAALGGYYIALMDSEATDGEPDRVTNLKVLNTQQSAAEFVHDIVGPLNGIANTAELLLTDDEVSDEGRDGLELMRDEAFRLAHLLRGFLSTASNRHVRISASELIQLINKCVRLCQAENSNRVKCEVVTDSDLPAIVGDEAGLTQVLLNLVKNAMDATIAGKIEIITRGQINDGHRCVELRIVDSGTGILPHDLPRVFEPFYTTKPAGKGTGVGLAIARRIVSEHHGQLTLTSVPGKGTTATVLLPVFARKDLVVSSPQRRIRESRNRLAKQRRAQPNG
jgi:signal transduction histidine kinase